MVKGVDRIVISVPELDSAVAEYRLLLGCSPSPPAPGSDPGSSCCFDLNNTRIELTATGQPGGISGLVLAAEGAPTVPTPVGNDRGLDIRLCGTAASGAAGSGDALRTACSTERWKTLSPLHSLTRTSTTSPPGI